MCSFFGVELSKLAYAADCVWTSQTLDPDAGDCTGGVCTCGNLTIAGGQAVTVPSTVTSIVITGDADISGTLSANGQGNTSDLGDGAGSNGGERSWSAGGGGGGGYGGSGGNGGEGKDGTWCQENYGIGGSTYGSNTNPAFLGSGGGTGGRSFGLTVAGGTGGGFISLTVGGTITVVGSITTNGNNGVNGLGSGNGGSGGGSGGSIYISASVISGDGTITARGGNGGSFLGSGYGGAGGGGGGRVAMYYGSTDSWSAVPSVSGGSHGADTHDCNDTGVNGSVGTTYSLQYSVADQPSVSAPADEGTDVAINPTLTSSAYSSDGASHTTSDWEV